ncbi:bis(5'-nucleosyl)-tetraphosphatase [Rhodotorula toruloides]|uniref:Bis(5'-nucleosyl)-tetraphosphatase n=1 Tax=Rhodotorula toruloides TaxID=5286 RepID=A0A511KRV7_RHOTO|nr:bis(5'-nucleosyl)-tetraphosphatase [Rhodotorula toruloides]
MDAHIPDRVASSFSESEKAGHIHLYASTASERVEDEGITHWGHVVPQLANKPAVPPKTPDLSQRRDKDPLEGPDYARGEKVLDLEESGVTYSIVHNLHALMPEHAMLIPHFETGGQSFRPQTSDLLESDLWAAWRIVKAYADSGREAVIFFNGGPLAGASQPHLHVQFCPFQHSSPPGPEQIARSLPPTPPSSRSSTFAPSLAPRLPLPWVQFYQPLPSSLTLTSTALYTLYQSLLHTRSTFLSTTHSPRLPPAGQKRESYNLFLTSRHIHLVPRTDRLVRVPRTGKGREGEFTISLNGLLYLGLWYAGSREDWEDVKRLGLSNILTDAAYANEEWDGGGK